MIYFLAFLVGLSLGIFGGGGSILTVPIFVYFAQIDAVLATSYSLFIVGASSGIGAIRKWISSEIDWFSVILFGIPSFLAVYATRAYLLPAVPSQLFLFGFSFSKSFLILSLLTLVMLFVGVKMIRSEKKKDQDAANTKRSPLWLIAIEGILVGGFTGFVGAGGGFLIVPALHILGKIPMRISIGTSLIIISIKSLVGVLGDLQAGVSFDWQFLLLFLFVTSVGVFAGDLLGRKIDTKKLKKVFGVFVLFVALAMIYKEFPLLEIF